MILPAFTTTAFAESYVDEDATTQAVLLKAAVFSLNYLFLASVIALLVGGVLFVCMRTNRTVTRRVTRYALWGILITFSLRLAITGFQYYRSSLSPAPYGQGFGES